VKRNVTQIVEFQEDAKEHPGNVMEAVNQDGEAPCVIQVKCCLKSSLKIPSTCMSDRYMYYSISN
jgi:hypothetical protein